MNEPMELTTVFEADRDYPCCRIPSLVTSREGTLLAFCEGRQSRSDHAENDIIVKRSLDGGRSWSPAAVVASEGSDSLNDPSVVVERDSGRIVLHYARFAKDYHTDRAVRLSVRGGRLPEDRARALFAGLADERSQRPDHCIIGPLTRARPCSPGECLPLSPTSPSKKPWPPTRIRSEGAGDAPPMTGFHLAYPYSAPRFGSVPCQL